MKKSIAFCLILLMMFSSYASAIKYSENGYIDGEEIYGETKTLFFQDFENTGYNAGDTIADYVIARLAWNGLDPILNSEIAKDSYSLKTGVHSAFTSGSRVTGGVAIFTNLNSSTSPAFIDGVTYTISLDVYFDAADDETKEKTTRIKLRSLNGTTQTNVADSEDITIPVNEWTTVSCRYTYDAEKFGEEYFIIRYDVENMYCDEVFYTDNAKITYTESVKEKIEVPYISFEDFEDTSSYSFNPSSSTPDYTIGQGGQSGKTRTYPTEFENAHSGTGVFGMKGRGNGLNGSGNLIIGSSSRLKFFNIFNLDTKTTPNTGWAKGWDMFTEEDIGKEYEISVWVYADSNEGAWAFSPTDKEIEDKTYGFISKENLDVNNLATKPSLRVGLFGSASFTGVANQSWAYGTTAYVSVPKAIEWDTWTEFKIHYKVSEDSIFGANANGANTLVNALGIDSSGESSKYYPAAFYVDDITVKEISVQSNTYLADGDNIVMDFYIPQSIKESMSNPLIIAGVFDENKNILDAKAIKDTSGDTLTVTIDANYDKETLLKLFVWDKNSNAPYLSSTICTIPKKADIIKGIKIDRISHSFNGDVYTQKGFNWYTTNLFTSQIAYVEKTGDTPNWDNAKYVTATSEIDRFGDFINYSAVRQRALVTNLTPNTEYFYKVGNQELNVWSDTFTFETADNTTNDASIYLLADPQSSSYSSAYPKGVMMDYVYEKHPDGEFILNLGDLVITPDKEQEWIDTFKSNSFTNPNITFVGAAGNHDSDMKNKHKLQAWGKHFNAPSEEGASIGCTYYSFDYKDMHIATIDSNMLPYDITNDEQIEWLKKDMQSTDKKWKILLIHRGPQTVTFVGNDTVEENSYYLRRTAQQPLFTELGIDLVLAGDAHLYSRSFPFKNVHDENGESYLKDDTYYESTILESTTINNHKTNVFDATKGVTYVTLGSVAMNKSDYLVGSLTADAPAYDIVFKEKGWDIPTEDILLKNVTEDDQYYDLFGYAFYNMLTVTGNDLMISVYTFDLDNPENGSKLFDQFVIRK